MCLAFSVKQINVIPFQSNSSLQIISFHCFYKHSLRTATGVSAARGLSLCKIYCRAYNFEILIALFNFVAEPPIKIASTWISLTRVMGSAHKHTPICIYILIQDYLFSSLEVRWETEEGRFSDYSDFDLVLFFLRWLQKSWFHIFSARKINKS